MKKILYLIPIVCFTSSCNQAQGSWICGTEQEKIEIIEKQFRGFDNTMVETGYRYQELFWAGKDRNWDYASYQLEKIEVAIENGLQRRPKRKKSADYFLSTAIPAMKNAINSGNQEQFEAEFQLFTNQCNYCHSMEKVPFFRVDKPVSRQSPIMINP